MTIRRHSFNNYSRGDIIDRLPSTKLPTGIAYVGELEELWCETPKLSSKYEWPRGKNVDAESILVNTSGKKPLVCAGGKEMILIISPDCIDFDTSYSGEGKGLEEAMNLHTDFHGVEPPEIKKVNVEPFEEVLFFGWLNSIVYSVPDYSERRGLPFLHKAKDKGRGKKPSKEKPFACVTPKHDMVILYGPEMFFCDRGIIG